jgi:hypothetical protein
MLDLARDVEMDGLDVDYGWACSGMNDLKVTVDARDQRADGIVSERCRYRKQTGRVSRMWLRHG